MDMEYRKAHQNIHHWLRYNYGSASMCQVEGCTEINFSYALKKGRRHAKKMSNYLQLCQKHHYEYDKGIKKPMISKRYKSMRKYKSKNPSRLTSIRITVKARNRLKVRAAQEEMSILDYIDKLMTSRK